MKHEIYFAHANSFPATVYQKMLGYLARQSEVGFIDTIGHNIAFPVTDCWPYLVDETLHYIRQHYNTPIVGVGHSLGGLLMVYAAIKQPQLFKAIIVLDSPLVRPSRSFAIWAAKRLRVIHHFTPGGNTLRRRDSWADETMVYDYFARKPLFARFDPDCLMDYALHGTVPSLDGKGRKLKFRPVIEHSIYCTLPHNLPKFKNKLQVPAAFIVGSESNVLSPADLAWIQKHFTHVLDTQAGSHLFPLEKPCETAERILDWIPRLVEDRSVLFS